MKLEAVYVPRFHPGLEAGVVEADESTDPKNCIWWPSEALDRERYPYYASLHGKAFLPYITKEVDGISHRFLIAERDSSWNAIQEALNNDDNW